MKMVFKFAFVEVVKIVCIVASLILFLPAGIYLASRFAFVEIVLWKDKNLDIRSCFALSWVLTKKIKGEIFFKYLCLFAVATSCLCGLITLIVVFKQVQFLTFGRLLALLFVTNLILIYLFVDNQSAFVQTNFQKAQQMLLSAKRE